ncbi:hypothetical protein [Actinomadura sp. CNU-125]|uniref:hypothetical protein n=1 Tax=Actinomadura sp. CNU-125 TaxID=1904961 RepID=UPI0011784060|nr:hypothetical protein [Actinomadura sp. CNU-125]
MTDRQHPDPITEGFVHSGQRLVQLITIATALQQGYARRIARLKEAQQAQDAAAERAENEARKAAFHEARSRWSPAHDRTWLRQAGLLDVAQAWGAAVPYTTDNASAATAVRKCEERLRDLHPHAMNHYDRLRAEGDDPLVAMGKAAPFFTRDPNVRTGEPAPQRAELDEGTDIRWAATVHGPHRHEWEQARQEQRARGIVDRLQDDHEIDPGQLRTTLEATTNLPDKVITKVTPTPQARLAADGFPFTIHEALEMSAGQPFEAPSTRKAPGHATDRNRRRNL